MSVQGRPLRRVVFHADDFGMNRAVNDGILAAFRHGLLTSTSLLANAPAAEQACQSWPTLLDELASGELASSELRQSAGDAGRPFDLGIHLNLTQGEPLTTAKFPSELLDPKGNFPGIGTLFIRLRSATPSQLERVEAELAAQIEWMCDHRHRPTHLNGHQYIEMIPQIAAMIPGLLQRFAISSVRVAYEGWLARNVLCRGDLKGWALALVKRHYASQFRTQMQSTNAQFADRFFGTAHAGRIDFKLVSRFLRQSSDSSLTEVGVHPAIGPQFDAVASNDPWFDPLGHLRPEELEWLCDPLLVSELVRQGVTPGRLTDVEAGQLGEPVRHSGPVSDQRKLAG